MQTSLHTQCALIAYCMPETRLECPGFRPFQAGVMLTWCVDDSKVGTKLVLYLDNNFLGPELLFPLQPCVFILYVVL